MKFDQVYIISIDHRPEYHQELIDRARHIPLSDDTPIMIMPGFIGKDLLDNPDNFPEYKIYPNWNLNDGGWWWWQRPALAGEAGGMISHTKCWEHAYENNCSSVLILEDDFDVLQGIDWSIFDELEDYDWDFCLLAHNSLHDYFGDVIRPSRIGKEHFIRPSFFYNTHSYILQSDGIIRLIEDHLDVLKQNVVVSDEFLSAVISTHPRKDMRDMYIPNIRAVATKTNYIGQTRFESAGNSLTETDDVNIIRQ